MNCALQQLGCLLLAVISANAYQYSSTIRVGSVIIEGNYVLFVNGKIDKHASAYGFFNASIQQSGWGILEIHNGKQIGLTDNQRFYAAGFLEGILTSTEILQNLVNMKQFWFYPTPLPKYNKTMDWLKKQDTWARSYVKNNPHDPLARSTGYLLQQFDGLLAGVRYAVSQSFSKEDLMFLVNTGDMLDLGDKFSDIRIDYDKMTPRKRRQFIALRGMCSALVKVTPGFENIFMSHVSWFNYAATLRIYKHYILDLKDTSIATGKQSFSSYAGMLSSLDDFYILGSNMVMLQTTNDIMNPSLYKLMQPTSLVSWQRVRAANQLASNGKEWADVIKQHNSGTYNNQYMVIDLNRVHLKKGLENGALTIVEQIPGLVESSDQTSILNDGYWPSYNVPFHERIYNLSGYQKFADKYGADMSYQLAPRAKIFRRDANNVRTLEDMKRLMRSNNYKTDPYSDNDPSAAICARGDLISDGPTADGCYDGKVTDLKMAKQLRAKIISGPTTAGNTLKPFSWLAEPFAQQPHVGLPPVYNFDWIESMPILATDDD